MIINDIKLYSLKENTTYEQRISGLNNYSHDVCRGRYNGSGGKFNYGKTIITLSCLVDENELYADISECLKEIYNRERFTKRFIKDLMSLSFPSKVEIPNEYKGNLLKIVETLINSAR